MKRPKSLAQIGFEAMGITWLISKNKINWHEVPDCDPAHTKLLSKPMWRKIAKAIARAAVRRAKGRK